MAKEIVLFCDFDGTITERDNIIAIMKQFAPPDWESITEQILSQQISIRKGVGALFQLLPSNKREEITQFVINQANIRPGFSEFVNFCKENGIKLLITSGGIDFFVYPILSPYIEASNIYCNESSFAGERIEILWPNPCDEHCTTDCGLCKSTILRNYPEEAYTRIVIGDSITDLAAANLADHTIARHFLLEKCRELHLQHDPFHDFYDVIRILEQRLTEGVNTDEAISTL